MSRSRSTIILLLLLFCPIVWAQIDREFWFAAPQLALHSQDATMRFYVFAEEGQTEVTISMPANPAFEPIHLTIDSGGYKDLLLAPDYEAYMNTLVAPHGKKSPKGILVRSTLPISCYCQLTGVNNEAFVPRGQYSLGKEFIVAMQNKYRSSNVKGTIYRDAYSSVQIVATEDNTIVHIQPSAPIGENGSTQPFTVTLNRGEAYAFRAYSKRPECHLTGTKINADKPIMVMSTDDSASPHQKAWGEDAVIDQLLPTEYFNTDFIAVGRNLSWEGCFITAREDCTKVVFGDGEEWMMSAGETRFATLGKTYKVRRIHAEKPVQVFQISGWWNEMGGVLLPEINQPGSMKVHYKRMNDSRHTSLNIIAHTSDTNAIYINDEPVPEGSFQVVPGDSAWSYAVVDESKHPIDQLLTITSRGQVFHVGIVDATSCLPPEQHVMTSASYSYFSHYSAFKHIPVEPLHTRSTLIVPHVKDSFIIPDSIFVKDTIETHEEDTIKKKKMRHRFGIYMEGAYSYHPFVYRDLQWGLGYGAGAGVFYEIQKKHFLFDIGAGFLWQDVGMKYKRMNYTRLDIDTQNDQNNCLYAIDRTDRSRLGYVEVPVLFGGSWGAFYMLTGVKVGIPLFGSTKEELAISTAAEYDQYFIPFTEMANHGLRYDAPEVRKGDRIDYTVDTRLTLEFGVNLGNARIEKKKSTTEWDNNAGNTDSNTINGDNTTLEDNTPDSKANMNNLKGSGDQYDTPDTLTDSLSTDTDSTSNTLAKKIKKNIREYKEIDAPCPAEELGKGARITYRMSLFADMGCFWPQHKNITAKVLDVAPYTITPQTAKYTYGTWDINNAIQSDWTNNKLVGNFFVGIKLTVLFQ